MTSHIQSGVKPLALQSRSARVLSGAPCGFYVFHPKKLFSWAIQRSSILDLVREDTPRPMLKQEWGFLSPEPLLMPRFKVDHPMLYDCLILGGGPAGCATAVGLLAAGYHVALVTRPRRACPPVELLAPEVREALSTLGLWDRFGRSPHVACPGIVSCWGNEEIIESDFIYHVHGSGWVVSRADFDDMLASAVRSAGGHWFLGEVAHVGRLKEENLWRVQIRTAPHTPSCHVRWIVDATGRTAWLARRLGSEREVQSQQIAFGAGYLAHTPGPGDDPRLVVETTTAGWAYSLPWPPGRFLVVLVARPEEVPRGPSHARVGWFEQQIMDTREIKRRIHDRCPGRLMVASAALARCIPVTGQGWLATGEAASSLDPLSGRGTVQALETGLWAAQAIREADPNGATIPDWYGRRIESLFQEATQTAAALYRDSGK